MRSTGAAILAPAHRRGARPVLGVFRLLTDQPWPMPLVGVGVGEGPAG